MYTSFYQLESKPFDPGYEQKFYWEGEGQREVLSTMQRGLLHNRKFLYLKGEEGTGKTTLVHELIRNLGNDFAWALVEEPRLDRIDFYNDIGEAFGLEQKFSSKVQFLIRFSHFLYRIAEEEKKILLLIDECHQLSQELLEELWLLSNIEKGGTRLLNIYFVGQRLFDELLLKPKNNAVRQRITRNVELFPLDVDSTGDYVRHRVKAAGGYDSLFGSEAIQAIHRYCRGNIYQINVLCDNALSTGSLKEMKAIDHSIIDECAFKLGLGGKAAANGVVPTAIAAEDEEVVAKAAAAARKVVDNAAETRVQEESRGGSWLKYAAGLAALGLAGAGLYFWWPGMQVTDTSSVTSVSSTQAVSPDDDATPQVSVGTSAVDLPATGPEQDVEQEQVRETMTVATESGIETDVAPPASQNTQVLTDEVETRLSTVDTGAAETVEEETDETAAATGSAPDTVEQTASAAVVEQQEEEVVEQQQDLGAEVAESEQVEGGETVLSIEMSDGISDLTTTLQETEQPVDAASVVIAEAAIEAAAVADSEKESPAVENEVVTAPVVRETTVTGEPLEKEKVVREPEPQPVAVIAPMEPSKVVLALQPNSLELTRGGSREFERFIKVLQAYPGATLLVKGFVSSKTNSAENIKLSEDRAMGVQKLLIAEGIEAERIEVKGMGNLEPIASNDTREGRRKNRRVEIVVIDDGT